LLYKDEKEKAIEEIIRSEKIKEKVSLELE
jgi:hypothetical protein